MSGNLWKRQVNKRMHVYGDIDFDAKVIRINPRKGDLVKTIIHEELHKRYPKKSEKEIAKLSKKREAAMSIRQQIKLLRKYRK